MVKGLLFPLEESGEMKALKQGVVRGQQQLVYGVAGSQINYLIAGLQADRTCPLLIITASALQARRTIADLETLLPGREVLYFPAAEILPYEVFAQSKEITAQRLRVLAALAGDVVPAEAAPVVVAPVDALSRLLLPAAEFKARCLNIRVGGVLEPGKLAAELSELGYERVDQAEAWGQFSIRGGIVDVFPLDCEDGIRLEFFDDEVDSIRTFDVITQRSTGKLESVRVIPARELIISAERWPRAEASLKEAWAAQAKKFNKSGAPEARAALDSKLALCLERLEEKVYFEGIEQYLGAFYPERTAISDYLPPDVLICVDEPGRVRETAQNFEREQGENWSAWLEKGLALPEQARDFVAYDELIRQLQGHALTGFSLLPKQPVGWQPRSIVSITAKANPSLRGQIDILTEDLRRWRKNRFATVILAANGERCQKILRILRENRLEAVYISHLTQEVRAGNIIVTEGSLQNGFELTNARIALLTEAEIFGAQKKGRPKTARQEGSKISAFVELKAGDYVVHVSHGIGVYLGVQKLNAAGLQKDYLVVKYAGEDKLYVPTDQVGQLQKYLGSEGAKPKLSRLGGTDWAKVKSRVKESVQVMAQDLLKLYAARQAVRGYAFGPDTVWQREFEEAFPFEETPDQMQSAREIKADMERPRPMDRLLCGDVGYGKTEVAIRAAFKAVNEGKQVAVLVPTTILAQQHYNTFRQRFADFPVTIEVLSRFRTAREQKSTLNKLKEGRVDIVIGTHRLVQEDVRFKDLGLVIVDEEQRFGVGHKERLKQLRNTVDVLTLTATPIPRTLHMSLVGARDMSILETPPEDRYPVQTYVVEFNLQVIRDAILRELNRGGQVYFVHNRVQDIERTAEALRETVPEARIAVAHGQMREEDLERVMLDFLEGETDILVCTTIIETGMDIANVNTLIIDEADHLGLSQLYQLRGRVGRTNRLAYAYLTYKKDKILSEIAEKRLQAIREFTEFGSGFKIAMRDLEIRGAGNILGPEQHGNIMSVGFEMYCRLLEEAVRELQGQTAPEIPEPTIEIAVNAYLSDDYIPDQGHKMEVYRKLMLCRRTESVDEVVEELLDRFGDPPAPVRNLLDIAKLKALCFELGLSGVNHSGGSLVFRFNPEPAVTGSQMVEAAARYPRLSFVAAPQLEMKLQTDRQSVESVLKSAIDILLQIKRIGSARPDLV